MKKNNLLKILLAIIFIIMVASWFLPNTTITDNAFTKLDDVDIGLLNFVKYFSESIQLFTDVFIYILIIGGFYGVLYKIPQYRLLLDKIADGFEDKEWIFMITIGICFALLSALAGLSVPLLFLFPFVISIILLMGYDKITAALLTVGSVVSGMIGTFFCNSGLVGSGFTYASLNSIPNVFDMFEFTDGKYGPGDNILFKILLLVLCLTIILVNTIIYAKKHKDKNHLVKGIFIPEKVETEDKSILPIAIIFDVTLIVLALSFVSWSLFKVSLFSDITNNLVNPRSSDIINGLYGAINSVLGFGVDDSFGNWTLVHCCFVLMMSSGLLAFIYKKSFNTYLSSFLEGAKKALMPALLVCLGFVITIMAVESPMQITVLRGIMNLDAEVSVIIMSIVAIVYCMFIVDPFYAIVRATSYIGCVVTASTIGLTALIWQAMYGLVMFVSPVSIVLLATLSYLDISYFKWLKSVWKILLEMLAVILLILFIF